MNANIYVHVRDLRPGDLVAGRCVSSVSYFDRDYQVKFIDGAVKPGESFDAMFDIDRPVPDDWLDWSDAIFKDAPVITPEYVAGDTWRSNTVASGYQPVFVRDYYGSLLLESWPGVGPSDHPYTMKAMLRDDGVLCRPDHDNKIGTWAPAIVHNSNWAIPYMDVVK